uniref:asparagine synthase-related protein n=1 Tax=Flavobacterium sp. TaxID=239 RepID=UPI00404AC214
ASKHLRVALDGQGADELLAGYKTYHVLMIPWYLIRGKFRQAYLTFKDQLNFGVLSSLILYLRNVMPPFIKKFMRLIYGYEFLFSSQYWAETPQWIKVDPPAKKNSNSLNRYLIYQHNVGLENLLYYGDIVSMKNSIENRSPFLDHRLVDFAFSHDEKLKLHNAVDKFALRISKPYFKYSDILDRPKFGFPSSILFSTKKSMVDEIKVSAILDWPIFNKDFIGFIKSEKLLSDKYERLLFRLYQVHVWNELFISR